MGIDLSISIIDKSFIVNRLVDELEDFVVMHKNGGVLLGFYAMFERLCSEKGVSPAQVRADLGISQSTMASWKSRGLTPRYDTAKKLADYFDVSVDYLLSGGGQVSQTHLANGIHIYKNTFPFKVIEPFLADSSSNSRNIVYQDEYLLIAVDENAAVTPDELEEIVDVYAPYREKQIDVQSTDPTTKELYEMIGKMSRKQLLLLLAMAEQIKDKWPETTPQSTPSPQVGKDTTPPPDAPETPPEGE